MKMELGGEAIGGDGRGFSAMSVAELVGLGHQLVVAHGPQAGMDAYKSWIAVNPNDPLLYVVYFNLSTFASAAGDVTGAVAALQECLKLNQDFLPAYINLGGFVERSGSPDQAVQLFLAGAGRLLPVTGTHVHHVVTTLKQAARVLSDQQQIDRAAEVLARCLEIDPSQIDAVEQYVANRLSQCRWPIMASTDRVDGKHLLRFTAPLSLAAYVDDPLLQMASADRYARKLLGPTPVQSVIDRRKAPIDLSERRLRIGYLSSDLRDHAIGYLMAEFFELHDRGRVEVFAYYCGRPSTSALTQRIMAAVENWRDINDLSDDAAAALMAADGIDIVIDVNGYTKDARTAVLARRPAPIIVNWLGFPGTMATPFHHYIIADDWIIPASAEKYYTERVLRLPCYQPNDRKRVVNPPTTRADHGLPDEAFVFCCFNGIHKISRFTFDRWIEILKRVPGSVLWLLEGSTNTQDRLRNNLRSADIDGDRLIFAPKMANADHLSRYPLADLFLDTFPYGAHTTASDALWMGVPVVTLSGRGFASRVCGSLVRAAGLPDLVTERPRDYVEKAVALGNSASEVAAMKARLAQNRSRCTLFDVTMLTKKIEDLYAEMCRQYWNNELPKPNLRNLDAYLEAGLAFDHDQAEMIDVPDYDGRYRAELRRRHQARPMDPDGRLWFTLDAEQ